VEESPFVRPSRNERFAEHSIEDGDVGAYDNPCPNTVMRFWALRQILGLLGAVIWL
jgi:hypothetical protein